MKILFQIPVNIRLKIGNVSGGSSPDTHKWPLFWKTKAWTKKYSLLCESIIYDGADDVKMLSVHCIFLIKFYITRNQYVRRTRQFCPKWPILRRIFQKILIYIAYTLLPYWKHVHTYQKQLETKIYWVRKIFKCLGRVFLGISHFTGECDYFCPALDPPLGGYDRNTITYVHRKGWQYVPVYIHALVHPPPPFPSPK